ncbi:putative PurR-regulated permease PerM [Paraburkholderia sp. BL6669N2]|uniref:AI-2E family transporter YdiK n=1 Tax=Paraburkholderia sp. BL6669N2 TaxID=1938807 RepID=UPI000E252102|nr:AI-2E family transporter YdiK [Paraburkholderia sp. BL6669N2]REG49799.1 putative PurR-regulated permease PerM [Paraburkholderia sp. BL6669N2]
MDDLAQSSPEPQRQVIRPQVDLARIVLAVGTLLLLIGGSLYIVHPFVPALIWGTTIVVTTWPLMLRIQPWLGGRRGLAVTVMLLLEIVVICIPTYAAVSTLAGHTADIMNFVEGLPGYALPSPPHWLGSVPLMDRVTDEWQKLSDAGPGGILAKVEPYAAVVAKWLLLQMGLVGSFAVHLILMLIVCGLLYGQGEAAVALATALALRVAPGNGANIIHLTGQSIRAIALGVVVTALVQASLGAVGVWLAGIPFAGVLSALMLVMCLIQLGPLLPMLGCVIWLFMHDAQLTASVLLVWTIAVSALDNILRPILIRRAVALPMVLILSGVLGGLIAIGAVGLFIGPVILAVTYHLLRAWIDQPDKLVAQGNQDGQGHFVPRRTD